MSRIYAGIGARKTPVAVLSTMAHIAEGLSEAGWILRSGHAVGADQAFESHAGAKEIYLPWDGFEGGSPAKCNGHIIAPISELMTQIAKDHHPNWDACRSGARAMHTRNVCQVLGPDCETWATMVVCWTPGGRAGGGTGQAIRIAVSYGIPVFDLAIPNMVNHLIEFVNDL